MFEARLYKDFKEVDRFRFNTLQMALSVIASLSSKKLRNFDLIRVSEWDEDHEVLLSDGRKRGGSVLRMEIEIH